MILDEVKRQIIPNLFTLLKDDKDFVSKITSEIADRLSESNTKEHIKSHYQNDAPLKPERLTKHPNELLNFEHECRSSDDAGIEEREVIPPRSFNVLPQLTVKKTFKKPIRPKTEVMETIDLTLYEDDDTLHRPEILLNNNCSFGGEKPIESAEEFFHNLNMLLVNNKEKSVKEDSVTSEEFDVTSAKAQDKENSKIDRASSTLQLVRSDRIRR